MRYYLGLFGYFSGGSATYFGLGRGPVTPPAMVRTDRKDLKSNKKNDEI